MNNKNEVLLQVSPPSSTLYNIDTIHDIINLILFGILSYYFYIFYINRKKIENMDMSLFASDDKYATVGLKRKLENMERELIYEKNNSKAFGLGTSKLAVFFVSPATIIPINSVFINSRLTTDRLYLLYSL